MVKKHKFGLNALLSNENNFLTFDLFGLLKNSSPLIFHQALQL